MRPSFTYDAFSLPLIGFVLLLVLLIKNTLQCCHVVVVDGLGKLRISLRWVSTRASADQDVFTLMTVHKLGRVRLPK